MKARQRNFGKAEMAGWLDGKTAIPIEPLAVMPIVARSDAELTERAVISYALKRQGDQDGGCVNGEE